MDQNQDKSDDLVDVDQQPVQSLAQKDGGYSSRKLWYGIGTSVAIVLGGVFYALCTGFRTGYETYIAGLMGVFGLYLGANVTARHVTAKHVTDLAKALRPQPPTAPDPRQG